MAEQNQPLRELVGPLHPPKDEEEEEEDDDDLKEDGEEEENTEFVDAEELCSGGIKAGGLPWRRCVIIPDEHTGEECKVFGRFPLLGPWWRVKLRVLKCRRSKIYQVQGFPSYFLQSDMSPDQKSICSLFLKECEVNAERRNKFLAWVNEVVSYANLHFGNLREIFETYCREVEKNNQKPPRLSTQEESSQRDKKDLPLESTIPFRNAMVALRFPKIMEFLPILLPRHFKELIISSSEEVLEKIKEILGTQPWKLGFSKITYKELKLLRCEASWAAFSQCPSLLELMNDLQKNALVIYSKLKQICREHGHTYIEEVQLTRALKEHMFCGEVWCSLEFLKELGVVTYMKGCVFLYELYEAEQSVASSICELMSRRPWNLQVDVKKVLASVHTAKPRDSSSDGAQEASTPGDPGPEMVGDILDAQSGENSGDEADTESSDAQLDQDQVAALKMICSNAVTVVSGKGGCGKTTIVSHLFTHVKRLEENEVKRACEDFEHDQDAPEEWLTVTKSSPQGADKTIEVLLTAPTGKATGLLRQKTGLPAYTLYQVNYSFYSWKKREGEKDCPWKFSSVRVLVVDEGSLVSVGILKSVLKLLCEHAKLSKLIILGDIRQLPSIEPGNMLKDVFETLKSRHCAIELKTNHRSESQLIVDNATRISNRQYPEFDAELNIFENPTLPLSIQDKTFIFVRLPEEDANSQSSKSDHQSHLYSAVKTLLGGEDFKDAKTSQFIAFRRQDCNLVNDCCRKHYNGSLIKDHQKKLVFGVHDKICCTRNAYLKDLLPKNDKHVENTPDDTAKKNHDLESGIRLCNGEIFFITADVIFIECEKKRRLLTINNNAGLEVTVDFKKLRKLCRIRHAWARTIHTFQGSEEDTVAYVVGKAGRQHWQHVYTAVSRGRRRVYVIAEESQLQSAIKRCGVPRKTRLRHFLQNKLSNSDPLAADQPYQCASSGDSSGPSPCASPSTLRRAPANGAAAHVPRSQVPWARDEGAASAKWQWSSFEDTDTDEESAQPGAAKRASDGMLFEGASPSKFLMVEKPSPQVSSKFQGLTLNSIKPRQLFKPTDTQEAMKTGVVVHPYHPCSEEDETGGS